MDELLTWNRRWPSSISLAHTASEISLLDLARGLDEAAATPYGAASESNSHDLQSPDPLDWIVARPQDDARRGALFDCAVEQLDAQQFWNLQRWVIKPARLLYMYEPSSTLGAPVAVLDLEAYDSVWIEPELTLVRRGMIDEVVRARLGNKIGLWQEATSRSYDDLANEVVQLHFKAEIAQADAGARGAALEAQLAQLQEAAVLGERDATSLQLALAAAEADVARLAARAVVREADLDEALAANRAAEAALAANHGHAATMARLENYDAAERAAVASQQRNEKKILIEEKKILIEAVRDLRRRLARARVQRANLVDHAAHWAQQEPKEAATGGEADEGNASDCTWLEELRKLLEDGDDDAADGASTAAEVSPDAASPRPMGAAAAGAAQRPPAHPAVISFRDLSSGETREVGAAAAPVFESSPTAAAYRALSHMKSLTQSSLDRTFPGAAAAGAAQRPPAHPAAISSDEACGVGAVATAAFEPLSRTVAAYRANLKQASLGTSTFLKPKFEDREG